MHFSLQKLAYPLTALLLLLAACGTPYQPEEDPDEEQEEQEETIEQNDPVPPDGILETVTWNLLGYGTGFTGPSDQELQTENIVEVVDSLDADLYAFQEVNGQEPLNDIVQYMEDYSGFTAEHVGQQQKMAFVFNTNTIDSVSSGPITEGQNSNAWAGRYPLYFEFDYNYEGERYPIYAVVIHAKAFDDQESYERRKTAAQDLYDYLQEQKPEANIVFLGDYNDDVDESIYEPGGDPEETPYQAFVENPDHFEVVTKTLSESGESSTVNYPDMIDHITMSNELYSFYMDGSADAYTEVEDFIDNYGETTSDHYPIWSKFDVTAPKTVINE